MDNTENNADSADSNMGRSAEEVAWDEEFTEEEFKDDSSLASTVGELLSLAVKVPVALIQLPMELLPQDTRRHARAATREGFLAVRSLLGAIGDSIEGALAEPTDKPGAVSGPSGTWGNARHSQAQSSGSTAGTEGKLKHIALDDNDISSPSGAPTSVEDEDPREGRGLRADIDY